jgi:hypothetical protein
VIFSILSSSRLRQVPLRTRSKSGVDKWVPADTLETNVGKLTVKQVENAGAGMHADFFVFESEAIDPGSCATGSYLEVKALATVLALRQT